MKYALSVLTMTMALSSGAAFAELFGTAEQSQVDITFSLPSGLAHNIVPVNGLLAGPIEGGKVLANGTVTLSEGAMARYMAVKFVDGDPFGNAINARMLSGQSNNDNKLTVVTYAGEGFRNAGLGGQDWVLESDSGVDVNIFSYSINAHGGQIVAADTYRVTLSAQRWAQ